MWRELKNKKKYETLKDRDVERYNAEIEEENAKSQVGKKRSAPTQRSVTPKVVKK